MKKLAVFDVNGTLRTAHNTRRQLQKFLGFSEKAAEFFDRYSNKEITYEEWVQLDVSLWLGIHRDKIISSLAANPIRAGAQNLVNWFREQDYDFLAISTGFDVLNDITCQTLNIPKHISNELDFDSNGCCTGRAKVVVTNTSKADVLKDYLTTTPYDYEYIFAIGDSEGDIPLFLFADNSLAVLPSHETVRLSAKNCIDREPIDLAIPFLKEEFDAA